VTIVAPVTGSSSTKVWRERAVAPKPGISITIVVPEAAGTALDRSCAMRAANGDPAVPPASPDPPAGLRCTRARASPAPRGASALSRGAAAPLNAASAARSASCS
jgi:hypothetical protein